MSAERPDRRLPLPSMPAAARAVDTLLDRSIVGGYTSLGLLVRRRLPGWPPDPPPNALDGADALVTGAKAGLGLATAVGLARLGARVHVLARSESSADEAVQGLLAEQPGADVVAWRCDVSDLDDVRRFAQEFTAQEPSLDVLVHNAGVMPPERAESAQGHELSMATHVLGPLLMTDLLRPALADAAETSGGHRARVVLVTSGGMYTRRLPVEDPEFTEGEYAGATAYARSKRTQVSLLPILARRWPALTVAATHPGWVDTPGISASLPGFRRLTRPALRDPEAGADTTVWLGATDPAPKSGHLWHDRRARPEHLLSRTRETEDERERMWRWCAEAAGLE